MEAIAHPITGSATTVHAIGPAQPWPDLRSSERRESASGFAERRGMRRPAMAIVTGTDETRQGLVRSEAEIERRSRREAPDAWAATAPA